MLNFTKLLKLIQLCFHVGFIFVESDLKVNLGLQNSIISEVCKTDINMNVLSWFLIIYFIEVQEKIQKLKDVVDIAETTFFVLHVFTILFQFFSVTYSRLSQTVHSNNIIDPFSIQKELLRETVASDELTVLRNVVFQSLYVLKAQILKLC